MNKDSSHIRLIRRLFRNKLGYDLYRYVPLINLMKSYGITDVIDVGANAGQTYRDFRDVGFTGMVHSFEPNPETFAILEKAKGYNWNRYCWALSSINGSLDFYITNASECCSLYKPIES